MCFQKSLKESYIDCVLGNISSNEFIKHFWGKNVCYENYWVKKPNTWNEQESMMPRLLNSWSYL